MCLGTRHDDARARCAQELREVIGDGECHALLLHAVGPDGTDVEWRTAGREHPVPRIEDEEPPV